MRRTILLLSTMALVLLVVGGVAASKQRQEQSTTSSRSPTTTTDKSSGDVSIESTAVKASFASGSGANFLGVKVSDHGNLISFESPDEQEAVFGGREGYALCTGTGFAVGGHDTGLVEEGFRAATFSQPNGAGTFPLTVTRKTTDGALQLKQVWSKPDATEKDVTVTMTIKNVSDATIFDLVLSRSGDFDIGASSSDQGARTGDSVWLWDDVSSSADASQVGLMLTALTLGSDHKTLIERSDEWVGVTREVCTPGTGLTTPTSAQDLAMRVFYNLPGGLNAGQSKTVKYEYSRM